MAGGRDGKPLAVLKGHTEWVVGAVFAPDGGRGIRGLRSRSLLIARAGDNLAPQYGSQSGTRSGTHRNLACAEPPFLSGTATCLRYSPDWLGVSDAGLPLRSHQPAADGDMWHFDHRTHWAISSGNGSTSCRSGGADCTNSRGHGCSDHRRGNQRSTPG